MLRSSITETESQRRLVLEGQMIGGSVAEMRPMLDLLWEELNGRHLVIDMTRVVLLSQEGENLLLQLLHNGARLCPRGVVAKCILQQVTRRSKKQVSDLVVSLPSAAEKGRTSSSVFADPASIQQAHKRNYATVGDFAALFEKELNSFYLLSYVLTGDRAKAEQCFLAALDDCINHKFVPKRSVRPLAKRRIIDHAIRTIRPSADGSLVIRRHMNSNAVVADDFNRDSALANLFRLSDFQRFAFVISVLERHCDRHCAILLGCTAPQVREARTEAIREIARLSAPPIGSSREFAGGSL
jgi:hypothetical protein